MNALRFRVFRFVIQHFGVFRRVWLLTQAFDFGLGILTLFTAPSVFFAIRKVVQSIGAWPGVSVSAHKLGGRQFNWRGNELGHIHSNGVADIRLNAAEQAEVVKKNQAQRHHVAPNSTWVTFFIERRNDQNAAVEALFRIPFERFTHSSSFESPSEEYVP